ncbi:MAG: NAD(P)H-hydrate dehydratase, partial [Lachnospiraceae bacterium]|nr:NAD(P)H-hydrate dehydratase [Lachnospiraceae bacterium]
DVTVTFGFCKRGLVLSPGCAHAGKVITAPIGIGGISLLGDKPGMFYYDEEVRTLLPPRNPLGNKGTFGKLLLIAGSHNMAGAAVLAARAAYRTGAGMVKVITSDTNRIIIQQCVPEALLGTKEDLKSSLQWADVIAIGPGLGCTEEAGELLKSVLLESSLPLVLDADALNLLAQEQELQEALAAQNREVIMTPHVGELSRLTGHTVEELKEALAEHAMKYAEKLKKIIVAKDARTYICKAEEPVCVNLRGNSGMATAGSGDVLTGIIAALLAQGMKGFEAAGVGVYLHACAGEYAAEKRSEYACMAGDIADAVGGVIERTSYNG